jgi:hypothetical protein
MNHNTSDTKQILATNCIARKRKRRRLVVAGLVIAALAYSVFNILQSSTRLSPQWNGHSLNNRQKEPWKDLKYLMDPAHSPRLRHFSDMDAFPVPAFHGCRRTGLCKFSNVCFSPEDGMLVFEVPGLESSSNTSSASNAGMWHESSRDVTLPRKIRRIPHSIYSKLTNVHFAKSMYVLNCWRQHAASDNPAHLLMGYGKLFVASSGYYKEQEQDPLDTYDMIVYHQCPVPWWPWAQLVDSLINKHAVLSGTINITLAGDINEARIFVPGSRKMLANPMPNDVVICGERVFQEPFSVAKYFGSNNPTVIKKWQDWLTKQQRNHVPNSLVKNQLAGERGLTCPRNLRFAMWKRTEGSALRLLTNENDIRHLVGEFSDHPLSIVTANANTPPEEQISVFRSFDILITPHGSHLANMIFARRHSVFIEVAAVFYDEAPLTNGAAFAAKWILSLGHAATNEKLSEKMVLCLHRDKSVNGTCPHHLRGQFIQSNLIVNTTILRHDIESAVAKLCGRSGDLRHNNAT